MAPAHLLARAVEGVQERTVCGALVTFCAVASIALLLFFELSAFFAPVTIHHLGVDDGDSAWGSRSFKAVWKSNLQPEFNVGVCDSFDASSSAVLRELDESNRFVQKSAESASI